MDLVRKKNDNQRSIKATFAEGCGQVSLTAIPRQPERIIHKRAGEGRRGSQRHVAPDACAGKLALQALAGQPLSHAVKLIRAHFEVALIGSWIVPPAKLTMQLFCKRCGKQILAEDMNLEMALAKCRGCSSVFSILDSLKEGDEPAVGRKRERLPVPMPKGYKVEDFGRELTITYRWFSPAAFALLIFCVFWDGFLIVWYFIGFRELFAGNAGWMALVMLLFPILHVAVGVGLTYSVICMFLNRTEIRVVGGNLSVWHGPIPFPGRCTIPTTEIKQLYVTESRHQRKNGCSFSYDLHVLKQDETPQKLIGNLQDVQQALYLEQKLEQHLGIVDQQVGGEVEA
jgi:hypothetical protein